MLFVPEFMLLQALPSEDTEQIERIKDRDDERALISLGEPWSNPFRLAVDRIQEDLAAPREILARVEYREDDDEERDIGDLEDPKEYFMARDFATVR